MKQFMNRRMMILAGLTLAASGFLLFDLVLSPGKSRRPAARSSPAVSPAPAPATSPVAPPVAALAATRRRTLAVPPPADQPWGGDPFVIEVKQTTPQTVKVDIFTDVKLTGIVWGPDGYIALVNDFVVKTGDRVQGMRIVRITADGVEIERDGEIGFVHLIKPDIMP